MFCVRIVVTLKLALIQDGSEAKENVRKWLCSSNADRRDKLLACGALIVAELRFSVLKETEFTCSAGIAHNKVEMKLSCSFSYSFFFSLQ